MENTNEKLAAVNAKKASQRLVLVKAYKQCFKGAAGKVVLQDLASQCHLITSTYKPKDQAIDMALKEGKRHVICAILGMMEMDTVDIIGLIKDTNKQMDDVRKGIDFVNTTDNDDIFTGGSDA
jgi:hypothetical protein